MTDVNGSDHLSLLREVRQFCAEFGIQPTTFGKLAVNNGRVVNRLSQGVVTYRTAQRLRDYMDRRRREAASTAPGKGGDDEG